MGAGVNGVTRGQQVQIPTETLVTLPSAVAGERNHVAVRGRKEGRVFTTTSVVGEVVAKGLFFDGYRVDGFGESLVAAPAVAGAKAHRIFRCLRHD